jgi:hypothetical protein
MRHKEWYAVQLCRQLLGGSLYLWWKSGARSAIGQLRRGLSAILKGEGLYKRVERMRKVVGHGICGLYGMVEVIQGKVEVEVLGYFDCLIGWMWDSNKAAALPPRILRGSTIHSGIFKSLLLRFTFRIFPELMIPSLK